MATTQTTSSGGIGLGGAVFIVFLCLKLTGVIDWSWWWVTAPLWGFIPIMLVVFMGVFIYYWLQDVLQQRKGRKQHSQP